MSGETLIRLLMFVISAYLILCGFALLPKAKPKVRLGILLFLAFSAAAAEIVFLILRRGLFKVEFFGALFLQVCNLNAFLLPLAVLNKSKFLRHYVFFVQGMGAIVTFLWMPVRQTGWAFLNAQNLCQWYYHFCALAIPFLQMSVGEFRPEFKMVFPVLGALLSYMLLVAFANQLLLQTGTLELWQTYSYTHYYEEIELLGLLYMVCPVPLVYLFPIYVLLFPTFYLICGICRGGERLTAFWKKRRKEECENRQKEPMQTETETDKNVDQSK